MGETSEDIEFNEQQKALFDYYKERFPDGITEEEIIEEVRNSDNKTVDDVLGENLQTSLESEIVKAWMGNPEDKNNTPLITEEEGKQLLDKENNNQSNEKDNTSQKYTTEQRLGFNTSEDVSRIYETTKQKNLRDNLQELEKQQQNEILRVEEMLNRLTGSIPQNYLANSELKESVDKQFQELFNTHDALLQKQAETKKHLETVNSNLQQLQQTISEKENATDSVQKQELQEQIQEFKADNIDLSPLEIPEIDYETPKEIFNSIPEKERLNLQSPWSAVLEKREKLNNEKTEQPKLEPQSTTIKEPNPVPQPPPATPAPASQTKPPQPVPSAVPSPNKASQPIPSTTPPNTNKTSQLKVEAPVNLANVSTKLFDTINTNNLNDNLNKDTTEFNFKNFTTLAEQTTDIESADPIKFTLDNKINKLFTPISDLPDTNSISSATSPNDQKLDQILGDTGLTNLLLKQFIETIPTLLASNVMGNAPAQTSSGQNIQIPVNRSNNRSKIEPSMPNIPGVRANLGLA